MHNKNIVLGMYGQLDDKDVKQKVKILKQFRKKLDPYDKVLDLDYNTRGNNYFCAITKK